MKCRKTGMTATVPCSGRKNRFHQVSCPGGVKDLPPPPRRRSFAANHHHEKNNLVAARYTRLWAPRHHLDPFTHRRRLFLGRAAEIRLPQPGRRPVHQIRISPTRAHGAFRGGIGDPRRSAPVAGFVHPDHRPVFYRGDDRSHPEHQDLVVSRHLPAPLAPGAAQDGILGRPPRDP